MQFKTKLGLVDIPNDEVMAASRDIAGSADSTPEIAAPSGAFSVAGGSNPGLSAEGLAYLWEQEAHALRSAADRNCRTMRTARAILCGKAEQLEKCAEELRRQQALPTSRQPESNAEVCNEPERKKEI